MGILGYHLRGVAVHVMSMDIAAICFTVEF